MSKRDQNKRQWISILLSIIILGGIALIELIPREADAARVRVSKRYSQCQVYINESWTVAKTFQACCEDKIASENYQRTYEQACLSAFSTAGAGNVKCVNLGACSVTASGTASGECARDEVRSLLD